MPEQYPQVELVAYTQGTKGETLESLLAEAFAQCYQRPASVDVVLRHLKHSSVLEHVSFTFQVKCSRVTWDQLTRHRIASYTAQSHRYTDIEPEDCITFIPTEVLALGEEAVAEWKLDLAETWEVYKKWRDAGVTKQSARYQAPMGVAIRARVTFNLRSLLNMLQLRTAKGAQEEIQQLAWGMWRELREVLSPELYGKLEEMFSQA